MHISPWLNTIVGGSVLRWVAVLPIHNATSLSENVDLIAHV